METNQIVHDLTIALIQKSNIENTPEAIVQAYKEFLPKIKKVYHGTSSHKVRIISKSELGLD